MMRSCTLVLVLAIASGAAVLFQDEFSGGSGNWNQLPTGAAFTVSSAGAKLTLGSTSGACIIKHDETFTNFSFSVKMQSTKATYQTLGILFCLNDSISGYCVTLDSEQRFNLMKYSAGNPTGLSALPFSHITDGANVLTVNHFGSAIDLYINGRLAASVTDATFSSGKIGFFLNTGESAEFDDVVVTDVAYTGNSGDCFTYDFSSSSLPGWYTAPEAAGISLSSGAMRLTAGAGDANGVAAFYSGDYDNSSIQVVVARASGSDSTGYGVMLSNVHQATYPSYLNEAQYMFVVNSVGQYGIKPPTGNSYIMNSRLESPMHGGTLKDTLTIIRRTGVYVLYANNQRLDSAAVPQGYVANAVGLFVLGGAAVDFDDMIVGPGDQLSCPITPSRRVTQGYRLIPATGIGARSFDVTGRMLVSPVGHLTPGIIFSVAPGDLHGARDVQR